MIVFRTDASSETGFGHIKRSSYLASFLKNKSRLLFLIGSDKIAARFLKDKKIPYKRAHKWNLLAEPGVKAIIFDLRRFDNNDTRLIQQARENGIKTIQITDLGLSQQEVDFTIDSSIQPLFSYDPGKTLLRGPQYAILHSRFRHFHKLSRKYRKEIKHAFICFGGAVDYKRLRHAVDLLSRHHYQLKIAPGFYLRPSARKTLKRIYPGIRFVGETESLARSFYEADIALITPGVAAFEAAAVGTPALYFYYHKEQQAIAQSFQEKGLGLEIANIDDLIDKGKTMIDKMSTLSLEKRIQMAAAAKDLVDGRGVYRIIDFLEQESLF
jgi:spore coat polysaccharide biosynthesis predicted glycosyltransferase SpsG